MNKRNRVWRWFAVLSVLAVVIAACGPSTTDTTAAPGDTTTTTAGPGTTQPPGPGVTPGLDDCDTNPLTCNSAERQEGGEVNMIIGAEWNGWNHHRSASGSVYLIQALEGISVGFGYFEPDASWTWDQDYIVGEPELVSDDPLTIRYTINDNAVWYDSINDTTHPVTVDDFLWTWYQNSGRDGCYPSGDATICPMDGEAWVEADYQAYVADSFPGVDAATVHCASSADYPLGCEARATQDYEDIVSVEADDASGKTFTVTYREGYFNPEWFASNGGVTYPAFVAEEIAGDWKNDPVAMAQSSYYFEHNFPYWSAGPFYIERGIVPTLVVMVPNPEWWGETKPTLDTLSKQVSANVADYVVQVRNGEFDGGWATPTLDLLQQMRQEPGVHSMLGTGGSVWGHIDFNMDRVTESEIRQALFISFDVQDFLTTYHGEINPPIRKNLFFSTSNSRFEDSIADTGLGSGDVERARQVLSDAGYSWDSAGKLIDPNGQPFRDLVFGYTSTAEERRALMEASQSWAEEIGITILDGGNPNLGVLLGSGEWDLVTFGWSGSPLFASSPAQLYTCGSGSNYGGMCNAEVDELAQAIQTSRDLEEAAVQASEVSRIVIAEEFFTLPLNDNVGLAFVRDTIANVRDNHYSSLRGFYNQVDWGMVAGA